MRLIIGCANFGKEYNGHKVPDDEIDKIWAYCREAGIFYADTADAYDYRPPDFMAEINKITSHTGRLGSYATLIHHAKDIPELYMMLKGFRTKMGLSAYTMEEVGDYNWDIVQIPYKALGDIPIAEVHARKVFTDDCFRDAIKDDRVDKIVIGVDNLKQLKENVKLYKEIENENHKDSTC